MKKKTLKTLATLVLSFTVAACPVMAEEEAVTLSETEFMSESAETETEPVQTETQAPETEPQQTEPVQTETQAAEKTQDETQTAQTEAQASESSSSSETEKKETEKKDSSKKETEKKETEQQTTEGSQNETESQAQTEQAVSIVGFYVDPSQYPAADVSENTQKVYEYLTDELGLNHAASCGVLANMQMESAFSPLALGDGGTSYGLCQWHYERFNSLISYCNSIGSDYNTVEGQLENLKRELEGGYSGVLNYLRSVPDTSQGAYDAGYYFCVYFESPANASANGQLRGNLAANEFFPLDFATTDDLEYAAEITRVLEIRNMIEAKALNAEEPSDEEIVKAEEFENVLSIRELMENSQEEGD